MPPSFGYDLEPIARHCLRAQRLRMIRDLLVTALAVTWFVLAPRTALNWLWLGLIIATARSRWIRRFWRTNRSLVIMVSAVLAVPFICYWLAVATVMGALNSLAPGVDSDKTTRSDAPIVVSGDDAATMVLPVGLALAALVVLVAFRTRTYRILVTELSRHRRGPAPDAGNERIARRLGYVAAAQRGNLTMHATNPFLGAGDVWHAWSFAITLRPVGEPSETALRVPLDPLAINRRLRERLIALRDPDLLERERVPGLYLLPYLVADGTRQQGDALIGADTGAPYARASQEAIDAIIRNPQGGLRYYQRVVVGTDGKAVCAADGSQVVPPQEQEIGISAFVHVAVEGGMLYAEFVATVLPPVESRYHLADELHPQGRRLLVRALRDSLVRWPMDTATAPWRTARGLWRATTRRWRTARADLASREYRSYDYGARLCVRQLAAAPATRTYLQQLDVEKYVKLVERAVHEALMGFLIENKVDVVELRERTAQIQNQYVTYTSTYNVSGNEFNAAVSFGSGGAATSARG